MTVMQCLRSGSLSPVCSRTHPKGLASYAGCIFCSGAAALLCEGCEVVPGIGVKQEQITWAYTTSRGVRAGSRPIRRAQSQEQVSQGMAYTPLPLRSAHASFNITHTDDTRAFRCVVRPGAAPARHGGRHPCCGPPAAAAYDAVRHAARRAGGQVVRRGAAGAPSV